MKNTVAPAPAVHTLTTPLAMIVTKPTCERPCTRMNIPNANGTRSSGRRRSVDVVAGKMRSRRRTMPWRCVRPGVARRYARRSATTSRRKHSTAPGIPIWYTSMPPRTLVPISVPSTASITTEQNTAPSGSESSRRGWMSGEWIFCGMNT